MESFEITNEKKKVISLYSATFSAVALSDKPKIQSNTHAHRHTCVRIPCGILNTFSNLQIF